MWTEGGVEGGREGGGRLMYTIPRQSLLCPDLRPPASHRPPFPIQGTFPIPPCPILFPFPGPKTPPAGPRLMAAQGHSLPAYP